MILGVPGVRWVGTWDWGEKGYRSLGSEILWCGEEALRGWVMESGGVDRVCGLGGGGGGRDRDIICVTVRRGYGLNWIELY